MYINGGLECMNFSSFYNFGNKRIERQGNKIIQIYYTRSSEKKLFLTIPVF